MKKYINSLILITGLLFTTQLSHGQMLCDSMATICSNNNMTSAFISDGQVYRALLVDDEVAEFQTTFFGGSTYRIAACSGFDEGNLIFTLYDAERNELFSSDNYDNPGYWDFEVENTMDCILEARLDLNRVASGSGCAIILIGFAQ